MDGGELRKICPEPIKKILKIDKGLCKVASVMIVPVRTEKIGLRKFLHSRKLPAFDSLECRGSQSAQHLLIECRICTEKRNSIWEEAKMKAAFDRICWEVMLTQPKLAKKAAKFIKPLGLIGQFRSAIIDFSHVAGSEHNHLD